MVPDNLELETAIRSRLDTKFVGQSLHYHSSVSSTMDIARKLAIEGAAEGTVVIANTQTAGRGRLNRAWLSPQGSLAMSAILRPSLDDLPQLVMIASLAVVKAIKEVANLETQIKWPNDVLVKGKKVCGILIESQVKGGKVDFAIVGIGINVNFNPSTFPEIADIATSLSHELGKEVSMIGLTSAVLSELEQLYLNARAGARLYREWRNHMETLGKWIQVKSGRIVEEGTAQDVTETGNLILRRADGSLAEIIAGDVTVMKV